MKFVIIDKNSKDKETEIQKINNDIKNNKHIFLFLFMDGCYHCDMTKTQWSNIKNQVPPHLSNNNDVAIVEINCEFFSEMSGIGNEPMGYPSLRYIHNGKVEEYEDCPLPNKDRSAESFAMWIESKIGEKREITDSFALTKNRLTKTTKPIISIKQTKGTKQTKQTKQTKKHKMRGVAPRTRTMTKKGGKWSMKYKRSINCNRPRGFSQRQHCKYGRSNWKK